MVEVETETSPHVSPGKRENSIYLPAELVTEARRLGLNISRISENTLTKQLASRRDVKMVGPQGFEPWTPGFPHELFRRPTPEGATVS